MDGNSVSLELVSHQPKEVVLSFPLIQELFDEGEQMFGGAFNSSSSDYYDDNGPLITKPKVNEKFGALTLDRDPSKYFFVFYDDRRGDYFATNTRGRSACLATQEKNQHPMRD